MFSQSTSPFVENCLTMCLVPLSIICLIELQFFGYIQILKYRLYFINCILKNSFTNNVYLQKYREINLHKNVTDHKPYFNKLKMNVDIKQNIKIKNNCNLNTINGNTKTWKLIMYNLKTMLSIGYGMIFCTQHRNNYSYCNEHMQIKDSVTLPMIFSSLQRIYQKLSIFAKHINYIYGIQIMVILTIKFATLTTLLYFCGMKIIK